MGRCIFNGAAIYPSSTLASVYSQPKTNGRLRQQTGSPHWSLRKKNIEINFTSYPDIWHRGILVWRWNIHATFPGLPPQKSWLLYYQKYARQKTLFNCATWIFAFSWNDGLMWPRPNFFVCGREREWRGSAYNPYGFNLIKYVITAKHQHIAHSWQPFGGIYYRQWFQVEYRAGDEHTNRRCSRKYFKRAGDV